MSDVVSFTEIYSQRVDLLPGRTLLTVGAPGVPSTAGDTAAAAEIDVVDDGGLDGSGLSGESLIRSSTGTDDNGPSDENSPGAGSNVRIVDNGGRDGDGGVDDDGPGGAVVDDGGRDASGGVDDDGGS